MKTKDEITIWADDFSDSIGRKIDAREAAYLAYIAAYEQLQQNFCKPDVVRCKELLEQMYSEEQKAYEDATGNYMKYSKHEFNMEALTNVLLMLRERQAL